jgi:hypothetical protein
MANGQLVIYKGAIYEVGLPYSHWLELLAADGTTVNVPYADPDLIRQPTAAQLAAVKTKTKRKRR